MPVKGNSEENPLFMKFMDEQEWHPFPKSFQEIIAEDIVDVNHDLSFLNKMSFSGIMKLRTFPDKISRKKFKKWLMGHGMCRNDAEILCGIIGLHKGLVCYRDIYHVNHLANILCDEPIRFVDIFTTILLKGYENGQSDA